MKKVLIIGGGVVVVAAAIVLIVLFVPSKPAGYVAPQLVNGVATVSGTSEGVISLQPYLLDLGAVDFADAHIDGVTVGLNVEAGKSGEYFPLIQQHEADLKALVLKEAKTWHQAELLSHFLPSALDMRVVNLINPILRGNEAKLVVWSVSIEGLGTQAQVKENTQN